MTSVVNGHEGDLSHPEDATTLEEFQARRDAELTRTRAVRRSWRHRAQYAGVIAGLMSCGALWYWFWQSSGIPRFAILALALAYNYVLVRITNHVTGTKRRRELDRLTAQWQARANR
jgi:hypothetical protein